MEDGLGFLIRDYDRLGADENLGFVRVPPAALYRARGERMEYKLEPPPGSTDGEVPGYLAVRCRRATDNDQKFMEGYVASLKAVAAQEHPPTVTSNIRSIVTRNKKLDPNGIKRVSPESINQALAR